MEMNLGQTIDFLVSQIADGKMEFSDMRVYLQQKNVDDKDISIVISQVDKEVRRIAVLKSRQSIGKNQYYGGLFLSIVGVLLTLATYFNVINTGKYFILAYGPICGGLILAFYGKSNMRLK